MRTALAAAISIALAGALGAGAQEQVVYSTCLVDSPPACMEADSGVIEVTGSDCSRSFRSFTGRVALGPLVNVGTIRVDIEARVGSGQSVGPLYVEIVPMATPEVRACDNALGYATGTINGLPSDVCEGWESTDWLPFAHYVPLGSLYAIRLTFLDNQTWNRQRIYVDCIRVVSFVAPVESVRWTRVKNLYR